MSKEEVTAILTHENTKLKNSFSSVDEYLSYRTKAAVVSESLYSMLLSPYILFKFTEAIQGDSPYFHAGMFPKMVKTPARTVTELNKYISEKVLEAASYITAGCLKWNKTTLGSEESFFIYLDPSTIDVALNNIAKNFSNVEVVSETTPEEVPSHLN